MHMSKKRHTLFYGWWVVIASFLITVYTGGVVAFGFTAVFKPLADEFGWSYTQISIAASLRGFEVGLLSPLIGLVVDRWGSRRLVFGGAICVGLGLVLLSQASSLGMFYGFFVLIAIGMSALSFTVLLTAVGNWFREKVSMATGFVVSGYAVGGILVPVVTMLIDKYDWRTAMIILGLGTWVIALPLSLLIRHKPEQYGYLPDGDVSSSVAVDEGLASARSTEADSPTEEAGARRVFWCVAVSSLCHMLLTSAVVTHVMPYLTSIGIARSAASLTAGALPLASIGGRLGFGWLGDKFDKRGMAAVAFALMASGLLSFSYLISGWTWLLLPFLVLFSTGWGGSVTMRATLLREYFGRSRFGKFYGFVVGVSMVGSIAGAPLAGWVFDEWGTYQWIWLAFAGVAVVALAIVMAIPPVKDRVHLTDKPRAQQDTL